MTDFALHERFRIRDWFRFLLFFMAFFVPAFLGMRTAGFAGAANLWIILAALFFGLGLPAILCRHCPHYARKGRFIICPSAVGPPKLRSYCDRPVSRREKVLFAAGFAAVLVFPFPFLIAGKAFLWAAGALLGAGVFILSELKFSCSKCLNFSCLLNRVPAEIKAAYESRQKCGPGADGGN
jgi:hypothetical protein